MHRALEELRPTNASTTLSSGGYLVLEAIKVIVVITAIDQDKPISGGPI